MSFLQIASPKILLTYALSVLGCVSLAAAQTSQIATQSAPVSQIKSAIVVSETTRLVNTTHPLIRTARDLGTVSTSRGMDHMLLVLRPSAEKLAALDQLAKDQQNASSASYHRWLTAAEIGTRFGPSKDDLAAVSGWLQSQGMTVNSVAASGRWIDFSGSVASVNGTFKTSIHSFALKNGETHIANAGEIAIPTALTSLVAGVVRLNDIYAKTPHMVSTRFDHKEDGKVVYTSSNGLKAGVSPQAQPNLVSSSGAQFITPGDLQTIYNTSVLAAQGIDGTGTSIAVIGRSSVQIADMQAFRQLFSLPANDPVIVEVGPTPGSGTGDELESALDLEYAGAMAPHATIKFVTAQSTDTADGVDLAAAYAVEHLVSPVITESYGLCEAFAGPAGNLFDKSLWQQAAVEGISVLISTGDNGSAGCDSTQGSPAYYGLEVSALASTAYNTAVGGTQFISTALASPYWKSTNQSDLSTALGYVPETTWNESCDATLPVTLSNCAPYLSEPTYAYYSNAGGSGGSSSCTDATYGTDADGNDTFTCTDHYPKPLWQTGPGVVDDGARDIPDVSLTAAGATAPYVICVEGSCTFDASDGGKPVFYSATAVGGTSAATPSFAGIVSLLNQKYGGSQGLLNYNLYQLAAGQSATSCSATAQTDPTTRNACIFHDVTTGTNAVPCTGGRPDCSSTDSSVNGVLPGWAATAGYDRATGLGSVDAANLVNAWGSVTTKAATVTLAVTPTSGAHGQSFAVSGTVAGTSGTTVPTGSLVLVTSTGTSLGTYDLTSGAFSFSLNTLPGGTYTLVAQYGGDGTSGAATSAPVAMTITSEASSTTAQVLGYGPPTYELAYKPTSNYGDFLLFRADVAGASTHGTATGDVTFLIDGAAVNTSSLASDGSAVLYTGNDSYPGIVPSVGNHTLSVSYAGDSSFAANKSAPVAFTVTKEPVYASIFTTNYSPNTNQPIVLTAYVVTYPGLPISPTGTVTLYDNGVAVNSSTVLQPLPSSGTNGLGGAQVALKYTFTTPGTHQMSIGYSGDGTFQSFAADAFPVPFTVTDAVGAAVTINSTPTILKPVIGQAANFYVTVSAVTTPANFAYPTGTVTVVGGSLTFGGQTTVQLTGGSATVALAFTAAGNAPISFSYSGDSTFAATTGGTIPIVVQKLTPVYSLKASSALVLPGSQVVLQTSLTASTNSATLPYLTGQVQVYDSVNGGTAVAIGSPETVSVANGAPFSTVGVATGGLSLAAGVHTLTSVYSGDTNYNSITTSPVTVTVANPDFALSTSTEGLTLTAGSSGSANVAISPSLGFTDTVTLTCVSDTVPVGTACSVTPSTLSGGTGSATVTLTAPATGSLSASRNAAPVAPGKPLWPAAIVAALVFFPFVGRNRMAHAKLFALTLLAGLGMMMGCGSVSPNAPTVTLTSSSAIAAASSTVTFSAAVASNNSEPITGNVTFTADAASVGQAAAVVNGTARIDIDNLAIGLHSIQATYAGDSKNLRASSTHLSQEIAGDTTVTIQANSGGVTHTVAVPVHLK